MAKSQVNLVYVQTYKHARARLKGMFWYTPHTKQYLVCFILGQVISVIVTKTCSVVNVSCNLVFFNRSLLRALKRALKILKASGSLNFKAILLALPKHFYIKLNPHSHSSLKLEALNIINVVSLWLKTNLGIVRNIVAGSLVTHTATQHVAFAGKFLLLPLITIFLQMHLKNLNSKHLKVCSKSKKPKQP